MSIIRFTGIKDITWATEGWLPSIEDRRVHLVQLIKASKYEFFFRQSIVSSLMLTNWIQNIAVFLEKEVTCKSTQINISKSIHFKGPLKKVSQVEIELASGFCQLLRRSPLLLASTPYF